MIQCGEDALFINPSFDHAYTHSVLETHSDAPIVGIDHHLGSSRYKQLIAGKTTVGAFCIDYVLEGINSHLIINYKTSKIFYDIATQSPDILQEKTGKERFELYIPDLSSSQPEIHLEVLHKIGGSKYVVPFPTIEQEPAISFTRSVMMQHLGTPKFLKPGQHLVHI